MSVDDSQAMPVSDIVLVPIERDGSVRGIADPSPATRDVLRQAAALYLTVGYQEPWIGYVALLGGRVVGTCTFKSAPVQERVEITYFTFPEFEGCGIAASMVRAMMGIARANDPTLTLDVDVRNRSSAPSTPGPVVPQHQVYRFRGLGSIVRP